jgi:hypothetical protein
MCRKTKTYYWVDNFCFICHGAYCRQAAEKLLKSYVVSSVASGIAVSGNSFAEIYFGSRSFVYVRKSEVLRPFPPLSSFQTSVHIRVT